MKNIQITYLKEKASLLHMIDYYLRNCNNYLLLDKPLCDIEVLYEVDMDYVKKYQERLKELEQITWN